MALNRQCFKGENNMNTLRSYSRRADLLRASHPLVLALLLSLGACGGGGDSPTAPPATVMYSLQSKATVESAGSNCPSGGARIDSGIDGNNNGVLDGAEVTSTAYVCNGAAGAGLGWTALSTGPVQAQANQGYVADSSGGAVVLTLPASPAVGDVVRVVGAGQGGWRVAQNAGQWIDTAHLGADALALASVGVDWLAVGPFASGLRATDVATSADGQVLLVSYGSSSDGLLLSRDGGTSFRALNAEVALIKYAATAVSPDGMRLVAAQGGITGTFVIGTTGAYYTSADGGVSWQLGTALAGAWSAVAMAGDGRRLLMADLGTSAAGGRLYLSDDFGTSWTAVGPTQPWRRVVMSADGLRIFALSWGQSLADQKMFHSDDGGQTWTEKLAGGFWMDVALSADGRVVLAGEYAPANAGRLMVSADGGATWTERASTGVWKGLAVSADGTKLIALRLHNSEPDATWLSTDSGQSWVSQPLGLDANPVQHYGHRVAASADGSRFYASITNGLAAAIGQGWAASTTAGSAGSLGGSRYTAADLQYVGNGRWLVVSHLGSLFVQ